MSNDLLLGYFRNGYYYDFGFNLEVYVFVSFYSDRSIKLLFIF